MALASPRRAWRDRLGIAASSLCAVHCIGVAVLLAFAPTFRLGIAADERFEWVALGAAFIVGVGALAPAYRTVHRRVMPMALFAAGLGTVLFARAFAGEESIWELAGAVAGGAGMVAGHVANLRLAKRCSTECAMECDRVAA